MCVRTFYVSVLQNVLMVPEYVPARRERETHSLRMARSMLSDSVLLTPEFEAHENYFTYVVRYICYVLVCSPIKLKSRYETQICRVDVYQFPHHVSLQFGFASCNLPPTVFIISFDLRLLCTFCMQRQAALLIVSTAESHQNIRFSSLNLGCNHC